MKTPSAGKGLGRDEMSPAVPRIVIPDLMRASIARDDDVVAIVPGVIPENTAVGKIDDDRDMLVEEVGERGEPG